MVRSQNILFALEDVRTFFKVQGIGSLKRFKSDQENENASQIVADATGKLFTREAQGERIVETSTQRGREQRVLPQPFTGDTLGRVGAAKHALHAHCQDQVLALACSQANHRLVNALNRAVNTI